MIYSVRGNLILMEAGLAVVECNGIGFRVQTSLTTQRQLKLNSEVTLFTHIMSEKTQWSCSALRQNPN